MQRDAASAGGEPSLQMLRTNAKEVEADIQNQKPSAVDGLSSFARVNCLLLSQSAGLANSLVVVRIYIVRHKNEI